MHIGIFQINPKPVFLAASKNSKFCIHQIYYFFFQSDNDDVFNEIVAVPPVSSRPARRKASQKKKYVFSDSEDSEEEKYSEPENPNDETFDAADEWGTDNDLMDSE